MLARLDQVLRRAVMVEKLSHSVALCAALMVLAARADAQVAPLIPQPTQIHEIPGEAQHNLTMMPVTKLYMGSFTAIFETTRLEELPGTVYAQGHDGAANETLHCYTIIAKAENQRIWIRSNSEMEGGAVGDVNAEYVLSSQTIPKACPELSKVMQPLSLDNGIWLGMSEIEVMSRLGAPSGRDQTVLVYSYLRPVLPLNPDRQVTIGSVLKLEFQDNKVIRLSASKQSSI